MFPLAVALILVIALVTQIRFLRRAAKWVQHTDQVISLAERIYRMRIDQETGLRAFLLTHDQRFLEPYAREAAQAHDLEEELRGLTADSPEQSNRNQAAILAHQTWAAWAERAINMARAGQDVSTVAFQLQGKELMDRYREARTQFINPEEQLRAQRLARSQAAFRDVTWIILGLCLGVGAISATLERKQLLSLSAAFRSSLDAATASAAEARMQHEWFYTTLKSIGDAVIATGSDGTIMFMNPVAESLTGWELLEAAGKDLGTVFRVMSEETREPLENPIDKVRRLNRVVGLANHTILVKRDGQELIIDDSGAPIRDSKGAIVGFVLVFRDVTKQRGLETALQANERVALAGRLSASIAHEINNPLNSVDNLLFLINQNAQGHPKLQELAKTAQHELHRVTQISKNMLSLHREPRNPALLKVSELLDGVVALIEETIAKGRRTIRVQHGFTGEIKGFPAELRQVFTNVIKNAVEATSEGGRIAVFSFPSALKEKTGVTVEVIDDGTGIPKEMISRLFTPFNTSKAESGTGLGLWVSRSIVEKHGGGISIASDATPERHGTKVSIFLPAEWSSSPAVNASIASPRGG